MKLSLPKIRLSRKLLIPLLGIFVLFGGTGAFAVIFGAQSLLRPHEESLIGGQCVHIQTALAETPSGQMRLEKFIRMENADDLTRVKTAMRVARIHSRNASVDLIRVVVLDTNGPLKRADMRIRAIGAEVIIAVDPHLVTELKYPVIAKYVEGLASAEGRFYGKKVELSPSDIKTMMAAMPKIADGPDCSEPEGAAEKPKNGESKPNKKPAKKPASADAKAKAKAPAH